MKSKATESAVTGIDLLIEIMARLRDPDNGCPWDIAQTFSSIAPYTIEEAYEVADAIEREDMVALREELGDLLLQVVFHARMAEEAGDFDFNDIAEGIAEKMIRRHPHVFGGAKIGSADAQAEAWETQKAAERFAKGAYGSIGTLDGVAKGLPALLRAYKLQQRAARVGFDWPDIAGAINKLEEELGELNEVARGANGAVDQARLIDEFGDVLFSAANVARKLGIDPEEALRQTNKKFERRFGFIEKALQDADTSIESASLDDMEALWQEAKSQG